MRERREERESTAGGVRKQEVSMVRMRGLCCVMSAIVLSVSGVRHLKRE